MTDARRRAVPASGPPTWARIVGVFLVIPFVASIAFWVTGPLLGGAEWSFESLRIDVGLTILPLFAVTFVLGLPSYWIVSRWARVHAGTGCVAGFAIAALVAIDLQYSWTPLEPETVASLLLAGSASGALAGFLLRDGSRG